MSWGRRFLTSTAAKVDLPDLASIGMSDRMRASLSARGINSLFPIQTATYKHIVQGSDIVARARTLTSLSRASIYI